MRSLLLDALHIALSATAETTFRLRMEEWVCGIWYFAVQFPFIPLLVTIFSLLSFSFPPSFFVFLNQKGNFLFYGNSQRSVLLASSVSWLKAQIIVPQNSSFSPPIPSLLVFDSTFSVFWFPGPTESDDDCSSAKLNIPPDGWTMFLTAAGWNWVRCPSLSYGRVCGGLCPLASASQNPSWSWWQR